MIRFFIFMAGIDPCPCKPLQYEQCISEGLSDFGLTPEEGQIVCRMLDAARISLMTTSWGTGLHRAMSERQALKLIKAIRERNKKLLANCEITRHQYYKLMSLFDIK